MAEYATLTNKNPRIQFQNQNAETLQETQTFDLIISNAVFHWFNNLEKTIARLKQTLPNSGSLVIATYGPKTLNELRVGLSNISNSPIILPSTGFLDQTALKAILKNHFNHIQIKQEIVKRPYPSLHALLTAIKQTGTQGTGTTPRINWTPTLFKQLETFFKTTYRSVLASYQIFYITAQK
eukprot:gene18072-gene816